MMAYSLVEEAMTPQSVSSDGEGGASDTFTIEDHNHNLKLVQVVGIPGMKTLQFLKQGKVVKTEKVNQKLGKTSTIASLPDVTVTEYEELNLSEEEKRLLAKEGVTLPTHHPLTKFEERELKRIRRKIRNKISAQDSRKRKKEFLDKLQQRVQEVEEDKHILSKKVRALEAANSKLTAQLRRLQSALASANVGRGTNPGTSSSNTQGTNNGNGTTVVPAATTLLVLILSLALVVLPTMQGNKKDPSTRIDTTTTTFDDSNPNTSISGKSRTMMDVAMPNKMSTHQLSTSFDEEWTLGSVDLDNDEPLIKLPRFSFQTPAGDIGSGQGAPAVGPTVNGVDENETAEAGGLSYSVKGHRPSFQPGQLNLLEDLVD